MADIALPRLPKRGSVNRWAFLGSSSVNCCRERNAWGGAEREGKEKRRVDRRTSSVRGDQRGRGGGAVRGRRGSEGEEKGEGREGEKRRVRGSNAIMRGRGHRGGGGKG